MNKLGFVIGNGVSRKHIDLDYISSKGVTYGCNALYRDLHTDYLIAVDAKMVLEITKNNAQHTCSFWTNQHKNLQHLNGVNFFNPSKGWSSGPTALNLAASNGHTQIHLLGFDFAGSGDQHDKVNNVYSGTHNYKKTHERATYYGNWLRQTISVVQQNSTIKFIRVIDDNCLIPSEMSKLTNLVNMHYTEYQKYLKNI